MLDLYLCAATEAELKSALPSFLNEEGAWIISCHQWALDLIGPIITVPEVRDEQGNVMTPTVMDDRFHANLRLLNESLVHSLPAEIIVSPGPRTPHRVWA